MWDQPAPGVATLPEARQRGNAASGSRPVRLRAPYRSRSGAQLEGARPLVRRGARRRHGALALLGVLGVWPASARPARAGRREWPRPRRAAAAARASGALRSTDGRVEQFSRKTWNRKQLRLADRLAGRLAGSVLVIFNGPMSHSPQPANGCG